MSIFDILEKKCNWLEKGLRKMGKWKEERDEKKKKKKNNMAESDERKGSGGDIERGSVDT
jgi:hypothetical protein